MTLFFRPERSSHFCVGNREGERKGQNGTASHIRAEEYADAVPVGSTRNTCIRIDKNEPTRQNPKWRKFDVDGRGELVRAARILPKHAKRASVRMTEATSEPMLFDEHNEKLRNELGIEIEDSLLPAEGEAQILIRNGLSKPVNLVEDVCLHVCLFVTLAL